MELKDYLEVSGMCAHQFAIMVGLSPQTILNLLQGKRATPLTIQIIKKCTKNKVDLSHRKKMRIPKETKQQVPEK